MTNDHPSCQHCGAKSGMFWVDETLALVCAHCRKRGPFVREDGTVLTATAISRGAIAEVRVKDDTP